MKMISLKNKNKWLKLLMLMSFALFIAGSVSFISFRDIKPAQAHHLCCCTPSCCSQIKSCGNGGCTCQTNKETPKTIKHITDEFIQHREWLIKILWEAHVLPAMMLMTEQISAVAMHQVLVIGTFFDAKQQLENQRLLQELQAQIHKDYQPSTGMCQFGTNARSLAASDQNVTLTQVALSARSTQRQLLNNDGISGGGARDDGRSRLAQFKKTYCNPNDFGNGLSSLCSGSETKRYNKDVNFTQTIDSPITMKLDFTKPEFTKDKEDVMALSANLYGHKITTRIPELYMADKSGNWEKDHEGGAFAYMDTRAIAAKRSVAQAAFAAQAAIKTEGEDKVQPYMLAILKEMGIEEDQAKKMLGERPSYYAQMDLLTKKLYQYPDFYTNLYDKPVNIDRKRVSMEAIGLMQKRDIYRSLLRGEAIMSVWLDAALMEMEDNYVNETNPLKEGTDILDLGF